jgi:hypothetical protein
MILYIHVIHHYSHTSIRLNPLQSIKMTSTAQYNNAHALDAQASIVRCTICNNLSTHTCHKCGGHPVQYGCPTFCNIQARVQATHAGFRFRELNS